MSRVSILATLAVATASAIAALGPRPLVAQSNSVDDVRLDAAADGRPRVRIHATAEADAQHFRLDNPARIVVDIAASRLVAVSPEVPDAFRERIRAVRVARFKADIVRVVLDLAAPEAYTIEQQGAWWIVTFERPAELADVPERAASQLPTTEGPTTEGPTSQPPTTAPDGTLEVTVMRVAGSTIYISAGSDQGLLKGQAIQAERKVGRGRGTLEVLSAAASSAVLGFSGRAFPITRGDGLRLTLPQTRGPDQAVAAAQAAVTRGAAPRTSAEERSPDPSSAGSAETNALWGLPPNVSGRVSVELDGRASRTDWDPFSLKGTRAFLTPLTRLQFSAEDVGGGVSIRGRMRGAYRYGSTGLINPAGSLRVYELAAVKRFDRVPLRVQLGRFFSPYEAFSGYWDGLLLRLGGDEVGVGGAVGVEPDRWNQNFSTGRPKVSGFLDFQSTGPDAGIEGDFAVTHVRPTDSAPDQLYVGTSGRAYVGRFGVSHTLQVDQHPESGKWIISDLLVHGSVPLTRSFSVNGRWSRREPNYFWLDTPFSYRRDDLGAGTTIRWSGGSLLTDATAHQVDGDSVWTYSGSAALRLNTIPIAGLGLRAAVHVWEARFGRVSTASLTVDRLFGPAWVTAGYRAYRSQGGWDDLLTHQLDGTLSLALERGVRVNALTSTMVGNGILQQRMQLGVSRSF